MDEKYEWKKDRPPGRQCLPGFWPTSIFTTYSNLWVQAWRQKRAGGTSDVIVGEFSGGNGTSSRYLSFLVRCASQQSVWMPSPVSAELTARNEEGSKPWNCIRRKKRAAWAGNWFRLLIDQRQWLGLNLTRDTFKLSLFFTHILSAQFNIDVTICTVCLSHLLVCCQKFCFLPRKIFVIQLVSSLLF